MRRRFTLLSITMLGGMIAAPACGAVLGIDTDRVPADASAPIGSMTSDSNAPPASTKDGSTLPPDDGGEGDGALPPGQCDALSCKTIMQGTCTADGHCERDCTADGLNRCIDTVQCPSGQDCLIHCAKTGCNDLTCTGGHSCTFDCREGSCDHATCESPSCTFLCPSGGGVCDNAICRGDNLTCAQTCFAGPNTKTCSKGIKCCGANNSGGGDDDDNNADTRVCPPNSDCAH